LAKMIVWVEATSVKVRQLDQLDYSAANGR
jgi:hypothetical protein